MSAGVAVPGEHKAEPMVELTVEPMVEPRRVPRGLIWGVWWWYRLLGLDMFWTNSREYWGRFSSSSPAEP